MNKQLIPPKTVPLSYIQKETAFVKVEGPLLEKAAYLAATLPIYKGAEKGMFVGGIALRWNIGKKFKGKMGTGGIATTDVDMVFPQVPAPIKILCKEQPVARPLVGYGLSGPIVVSDYKNAVGTVFRLDETHAKNFQLYHDVCFFENQVGRITLSPKDYEKAEVSFVAVNPREHNQSYLVEMRNADLGLLMATMLTPQAIDDVRFKRVGFAIASNMERLDAITDRYVEVVERNKMTERELHEPLQVLYDTGKCIQQEMLEFFSVLSKKLGAAKSISRRIPRR